MGALMRAYDWSASPLGSTDCWPQSLRTAVRILLTTQHPMFIWWGPELIQFYNDPIAKPWAPSATRARSAEEARTPGRKSGTSSGPRSKPS